MNKAANEHALDLIARGIAAAIEAHLDVAALIREGTDLGFQRAAQRQKKPFIDAPTAQEALRNSPVESNR